MMERIVDKGTHKWRRQVAAGAPIKDLEILDVKLLMQQIEKRIMADGRKTPSPFKIRPKRGEPKIKYLIDELK
ncbi:hypothetical protein Hanom_Chr11g01025091 [Helianthus anomalus]